MTIADQTTATADPGPGPYAYLHVDACSLHDAVSRVMQAVSHDSLRYYLNGALLETEPDKRLIRLTATDGHRLCSVAVQAAEGASVSVITPIIIPSDALAKIKAATGKRRSVNYAVRVSVAVRHGIVETFGPDAQSIAFDPINGTYPDWRYVVPHYDEDDGKVQMYTADREALYRACAGIAALAHYAGKSKQTAVAQLTFIGCGLTVQYSSQPPDGSTCHVSVSLDGKSASGARGEIRFRAAYVADVCRIMTSDETVLRMVGPGSPVLFAGAAAEDESTTYVLMPCHL